MRTKKLDRVTIYQSTVADSIDPALRFAENEEMIITDRDGTIVSVNTAFCLSTGYSVGELVGVNPYLSESKRIDGLFYRILLKYLHQHEGWQGDIWIPLKNGRIQKRWVRISALKMNNTTARHYVAVFGYSRYERYSEQYLNHIAQYDALTGLPDRTVFNNQLSEALIKNDNPAVAVMFLDMDRLKAVNDIFGYETGDFVLQAVARRLIKCVGKDSVVARLGGDEFLIMLEGVSSPVDAVQCAKRIQTEVSKPFIIGNQELYIGVSIGISIFPTGGTNTDTLVKNAETAMDRAKEQGRNRYKVYIPAMKKRPLRNLS